MFDYSNKKVPNAMPKDCGGKDRSKRALRGDCAKSGSLDDADPRWAEKGDAAAAETSELSKSRRYMGQADGHLPVSRMKESTVAIQRGEQVQGLTSVFQATGKDQYGSQ